MPDYQNPRFKKPFRKGPPMRRDSRDMGPKKLYKADCANCGNVTEVPFRPNGMKPVYCRDCFKRDDEPMRPRDTRTFHREKPSFNTRPVAPAADLRIDALARQLAAVEAKLDGLTALIEDLSVVPAPKAAPKKRATKKKA